MIAVTGVVLTLVAQLGIPASGAATDSASNTPRVLDDRGNPVAGATVAVFPSPTRSQVRELTPGQSVSFQSAYTTTTDSAGNYWLPNVSLPNGSPDFTITVHKEGYSTGSTFGDVSSLGESARGLTALRRSSGPVSPREKVVTLRYSPTGAGLRTSSMSRLPTAVQASNIRYRLISERNPWARLTRLFSRTRAAAVSFEFESGGSSSLGWAVMTPGDTGFHGGGTRDQSAAAGIPFTPWRGQKGTRDLATKVNYKRWEITKTWYDCQRNGCTRHDYTWQEVRPEGFNGGEHRFSSDFMPRISHRAWCGGRIRKGNSNWVSSGVADTLSWGVRVYGSWLSSQAGFTTNVKTRFTAKTGPIRVCGLKGPALSASGLPVAVPA